MGNIDPIYDPESPQRMQMNSVDVKRACSNAKVDREAAPCFV